MIKLSKSEEQEIRREDKSKIDWNDISKNFILQEEFIAEFKDELNWHLICIYQKLSEDFIRKFKDKVIWYSISRTKVLSEEFLEEFKGRVDWAVIFNNQKLSEKFICNLIIQDDYDKFYDYILINSKNLTTNLINHPALNSQINFNKIALCYFYDLSHPNKWKTFL